MTWLVRVIAVLGVVVVVWCCVTAWPAIVHGHPAYGILLAATLLLCLVVFARSLGPQRARSGGRRVLVVVLALLAVLWFALLSWLRPFPAVEPALAALASDGLVSVAEYPTQIVMSPVAQPRATGVLFQPGARVDARAYAAVLRPLAESGFTVVVAKQPLGIAFLATGAFASARDAFPRITEWVAGGHSLGGTVAAMTADEHDADPVAPVTGLLLYASYPASDMRSSLTSAVTSISGSEDGLATPADIDASRADLPAAAAFVVVEGAVHAFFGDYGPQPGDGTPTVTHDQARAEISQASLDFVTALASS